MKRTHRILAVFLAVQIVLSVLVFWPRAAATGDAAPLLPDLAAEEVVAITITDETGASVELRREGAGWVLADAGDYPVQPNTVEPVLESLVALETGRAVAESASSHARLQVAAEDYVRRVVLETQGGATQTLYFGSAPQYTATHVRLEGQNETYLTQEISTWKIEATAASWIDTAYVSLDPASVQQVTLENAQGTFAFIREGEAWTLRGLRTGEETAAGQVQTVVGRATSLQMVRPLGTEALEEYGMADPAAVIRITTEDGERHTLTIGAQDPETKGYVAKYSESPYYVRVAGLTAQPLVENARSDFIQE